MSTNARIGIQHRDDAPVKSIHVHWDGYPSYVGRRLIDNWTNAGRVEELIALGDLSALGKIIGQKHEFETAYAKHPDWCLAYGRDRGEEGTEAKSHDFGRWPDSGQEWEYLYDASRREWWGREVSYRNGPGKWTPLADLVRQDEERVAAYAAAHKS